MDLEMKEAERLKELKLSEERLEESIQNTQALKFLAENEKNMKFRNKRQEELDKLQKQQVYTTALIRIRFPDEYVLQGTFGALEKIEDVYQFVKERLAIQDRPFYLYETPPKKILKERKNTLKASRLVPSGMLYFAWEDLDTTKSTDGPFMNMELVRNHIVAF
jgi:tether containing UBX domain for GLUT4